MNADEYLQNNMMKMYEATAVFQHIKGKMPFAIVVNDKAEMYELAQDVIAEFPHLAHELLSKNLKSNDCFVVADGKVTTWTNTILANCYEQWERERLPEFTAFLNGLADAANTVLGKTKGNK